MSVPCRQCHKIKYVVGQSFVHSYALNIGSVIQTIAIIIANIIVVVVIPVVVVGAMVEAGGDVGAMVPGS